ncbi:MAG: GGDEF domain-containing protein [Zoogloeaceae bacterium]|nr:GGDEF domain-containing protein [Zoogloeaceae bacterium]
MSSATAPTLLKILDSVENLSRLRFRDDLFRAFAVRALDLVQGRMAILYRATTGFYGHGLVPLGWCVPGDDEPHWEEYAEPETVLPADPFLVEVMTEVEENPAPALSVQGSGDGWRLACTLETHTHDRLILELQTPYPPEREVLEGIRIFLQCFENQLRQWEYANLDTLTGLLNRKTFDEQFDQFIAEAERAQRRFSERRGDDFRGNRPCWLGVVDIDHFKSVNDRFGHQVGDQVLLEVATSMQGLFRASDKLFRFGGEEFVIMLRGVGEDDVFNIFDRFRAAIGAQDVPPVGVVTVSVGYARIDPSYKPAELLGRADQALYYAKAHGRDQVQGFDDLVMSGAIPMPLAAIKAKESTSELFFD